MTASTVGDAWLGAQVGLAHDELLALCGELVEARSPNPPGDTVAVAGVVAGYLDERGWDPRTVAVDPLMPSVVCSVRGSGPGPHLVLNVHLDTMPPGDESAWTVPRYTMTRRDGRLHGLGMGNMKGAVAAMALAFRLLAERAADWPGRLTLTAVSDECVFGSNGAAHLLERYPALTGDALLCGEGPGWMRTAVAEKGVLWLELTATGAAGHSSTAVLDGGAVPRLARLVTAVDALNGARVELPTEIARAGARPGDPGPVLSANVGTVRGGSLVSQVATSARAEVDMRLPPGTSITDVEAQVAAACARTPGTRWRRLKGWEANWTSPSSDLVTAVLDAHLEVRGSPVELAVRLPASDASRWRARGTDAVCFGPQPTLSAGVDDYAEEVDVLDCVRIYATAALQYLRCSQRAASHDAHPLDEAIDGPLA